MLSRHATSPLCQRDRPAANRPPSHPDPSRILGISGTLAFNLVMLLVLLVPLSQPQRPPLPDPQLVFDWITPKPVPPDPPPVEVEIVRPQPRSTAAFRPTSVSAATSRPTVDIGSLPADPTIAPQANTTATELTAPVDAGLPGAGARLEYLHAPEPRYPRDALLAGMEGTVVLQVLVGSDGRALEVRIQQGSGHRVLDDAARRQVLRLPVEFRLGR
ncbi:MAG: TonB family protein [Pseudomonadota bacterium]|nr:TonB family protein [Pseudomonadota bacterium]